MARQNNGKGAAKQSRAERIRGVLAAEGLMSSRQLTIRCLELGIFDGALFDTHVRAFEPEVRNALKERDPSGMPFAGPTTKLDDDGKTQWSQPELWDRDDCDLNIRIGTEGIVADHRSLLMLVDYRIERWGAEGLPPIPALSW